ncbi:hypothetical protein BKA93DRAFT_801102 [Sparassis latifolia]
MANQRQLFLFDRIPAELLLMVKEEIPRYDLRTHVCFCRSHQRVGALYGSDDEQEQFWHRACWLAGIGLLPGENPEEVCGERSRSSAWSAMGSGRISLSCLCVEEICLWRTRRTCDLPSIRRGTPSRSSQLILRWITFPNQYTRMIFAAARLSLWAAGISPTMSPVLSQIMWIGTAPSCAVFYALIPWSRVVLRRSHQSSACPSKTL